MNQSKVLFIGLVWPEPTSSAAGKRILQLVKFFQEKNFEIIFCSAAAKTEASFDFSKWKITEFPIKLNDASFDEFLLKICPDFVVFDRYITEEQFGWRISKNCPETVQILDTEDLHLLRYAREKAYKKNEKIQFYNEIALREIASILRCDLSLMISVFEINLLKKEFKIDTSLLHYLPFMEDLSDLDSKHLKTYEERSDFVFIGNFLHEPNWQTVLHLKKKIWPEIRKKLPYANLHIYGAYPSQKVFDLHQSKDGFLVHGKAEDAIEVISKARVLLAPIVFGAGQKGKFIDAMQSGTPIATSSIGAEAMFENEIPGIMEDDENLFVEKTVQLYTVENLWLDSQIKGFQILKEKFDLHHYQEELFQKVLNLKKELIEIRNRNFIGQILRLNLNNSLKYMSLWIQEKNKSN